VAKGVPAAEVQKNFGLYQDQALVAPVAVTKYGRPTVVILAASEYERLKRLDRQALAVTELTEQDIAAIESAKIPRERRYRSDRLR
jgi:prevent-host-death family protein